MKLNSLVMAAMIPVLCLLPLPVSAQEYDYYGDNHSWSMSCNKSGYVLRSRYPVTRFKEAGTNSKLNHANETLYLGQSCDASHTVLGEGKWCWANGGFIAEFQSSKMGFPRQELNCPNNENSFLGCRC